MLAVTVATHRKMLTLSVGLFCLPHIAFGMEKPPLVEFGTTTLQNPYRALIVNTNTSETGAELQAQPAQKFVKSRLDQKNRKPVSRSSSSQSLVSSYPQERKLSLDLGNSQQTPFIQETTSSISNQKRRPRSTSAISNSPTPDLPTKVTKAFDLDEIKLNENDSQQTPPIQETSAPTTAKPSSNQTNPSRSTPTLNSSNKLSVLEKAVKAFDPDEKKLNENIPIKFSQMKINPLNDLLTKKTLTTLTPLQLLALQYYLKMTEVHHILLLDLSPVLESENPIKPGELGLFLEDEKLYCQTHDEKPMEITRSNDLFVLGCEADSYDRIQNALKSINNPDRYSIALQKRSDERRNLFHKYSECLPEQRSDEQRKLFKINEDCGPEALAELDIKILFHYTTWKNYSLKMDEIFPFIIVEGESIEKIKHETLLKKFWNYDFKESSLNSYDLKNIDPNIPELIASSAKFLINHITCENKINFLYTTLCQLYSNIL